MQVIGFFFLNVLMFSAALSAIDINTHCACKKLKQAVQHGAPLNQVIFLLQQVSYHSSITEQDFAALITQARQLAHESKEIFEKEVSEAQAAPEQSANIKAITVILGSSYLISSVIAIACFRVSFAHTQAWYFFPLQKWIEHQFHATNPALGLVFAQLAAALTAAPYGLYWGIQKMGHKRRTVTTLREKITNLEAIIAYLDGLQSAA